jgi:hypothetical protein
MSTYIAVSHGAFGLRAGSAEAAPRLPATIERAKAAAKGFQKLRR